MIRAKNYEKLSKFVKVTARTLSVPFFRTQCTAYVKYEVKCNGRTLLAIISTVVFVFNRNRARRLLNISGMGRLQI